MSRARIEARAIPHPIDGPPRWRAHARMLGRTVGSRVQMITQRFAVEFDRRTVGIAVRVPGGFMFYASDDRFDPMDGRLFRRARAIEGELRRIAKRQKRTSEGLQKSLSLI